MLTWRIAKGKLGIKSPISKSAKKTQYFSLGLCLVPGKYEGNKKNAKENDFLMFGCPIKNIKENQI